MNNGEFVERYVLREVLDLVNIELGERIIREYRSIFRDNAPAKIVERINDNQDYDGNKITRIPAADTELINLVDVLVADILLRPLDHKLFVKQQFWGYRQALKSHRNCASHNNAPVLPERVLQAAIEARELLSDLGANLTRIEQLGKIIDRTIEVLNLQNSNGTVASKYRLLKNIDDFTKEQSDIWRQSHGVRRMRVCGGAGTGKTFLAIHKAKKLADGGLRTLFLCNNPELAKFVREYVGDSPVETVDFISWLRVLSGTDVQRIGAWTHFDEPEDQDLDNAMDRTDADDFVPYQAILVDEAQDFRTHWWVLVEGALSKGGSLYIFHDDNQCLLAGRGECYPDTEKLLRLTKNCRNSQRVYRSVKTLYPGQLETDELFQGGLTRVFTYNEQRDQDVALISAVECALAEWPQKEVVVISAEPPPVDRHRLAGKSIKIEKPASPLGWQAAVKRQLRRLADKLAISPQKCPSLPLLSESSAPTEDDVTRVTQFIEAVRRVLLDANRRPFPRKESLIVWKRYDQSIWLEHDSDAGAMMTFFENGSWVNIPGLKSERDKKIKIEPFSSCNGGLKLYDVASFKGLEAQAVILYMPGGIDREEVNAYVGSSRAKVDLYVVADNEVATRLRPFRLSLDDSAG